MTQLRYMIDNAEAVWSTKDRLKRQQLLDGNPIKMHRRRFNQWLEAAAEAALEEAARQQVDEQEAVQLITDRLIRVQEAWNAEAKRRHQ